MVQDTLPLNYTDAAGQWQPIDPRFQAVAGGWINTSNTLNTSVAQTGRQAKISLQTVGVGWEPQVLQLVDAAGTVLRTLAEPLAASEAQAGSRSADSNGAAMQMDTVAPNVTLGELQAGAAYHVQVSALHSAGRGRPRDVLSRRGTVDVLSRAGVIQKLLLGCQQDSGPNSRGGYNSEHCGKVCGLQCTTRRRQRGVSQLAYWPKGSGIPLSTGQRCVVVHIFRVV